MGGIRGYGWGVVGRAGVCVRSGGVGGLEAQLGSEDWGRRGGDVEDEWGIQRGRCGGVSGEACESDEMGGEVGE